MSKEPTRIVNILDLVFTNSPSLIPRIESILGISDHDIVYFEFIVKPETRKNAVRPISLYSRANWDQMREDMSALQERYTEPVERTTEDLWLEFKTRMEANIPCKIPRRKDSDPWITANIRKKIRKRDRKYKRMKNNATDELRAEVKQLQREIQKMLRRSYWQYVGELFKEDDQMGDSRPCLEKFWT